MRGGGAGRHSMSMPASASYDAGGQSVGVGFGETVEQHTTTTTFNRGPMIEQLALRYGTRDDLIAWGVPVERLSSGDNRRPNPFPGDKGCPPPPGWSG